MPSPPLHLLPNRRPVSHPEHHDPSLHLPLPSPHATLHPDCMHALHLIFRRSLNPWKPANLAAESTVNVIKEGSAGSGTNRGFVPQAARPRGRRECACRRRRWRLGYLCVIASLLVPAVSSSLFFPVHLCYSLLRIELQRTSQTATLSLFPLFPPAPFLFRANPHPTTVPWTRALSTHRQRCCRRCNWLSLPADPPPSARPVPSLLVTLPELPLAPSISHCRPQESHTHPKAKSRSIQSRCTWYTTDWHYHPRLQKTRTSPPL
ncbi:hypothetical protein C8R45DRAFT_966119, partial [Mycena sanguinolenta]